MESNKTHSLTYLVPPKCIGEVKILPDMERYNCSLPPKSGIEIEFMYQSDSIVDNTYVFSFEDIIELRNWLNGLIEVNVE